ncbi:MAG: hypothetical protein Q4G04_00370 [bacterium]|nr:hypothetical protein [bacterium]
MKNKINYILLTTILFFITIPVKANYCTTEEKTRLNNLANQVTITYEHAPLYEEEIDETDNGNFNVIVSGLTPDVYVETNTSPFAIFRYTDKNQGTVTQSNFQGGSYTFKVISDSNCIYEIKTLALSIPKYNYYSEDVRCEGIDTTKFTLCDPWYQFTISEEQFSTRLAEYQNSSNSSNQGAALVIEEAGNSILDFILNYYVYIIGIVIIAIGIIVYFKNNKKESDKK